jgi:hypothetical protein
MLFIDPIAKGPGIPHAKKTCRHVQISVLSVSFLALELLRPFP